MSNLTLEFVTAPRLEHDIADYCKKVRFDRVLEGGNYEDQQKALDKEFKQNLKAYFNDWVLLMMASRKYRFSFWIDVFHRAYISVLQEEGTAFFEIDSSRSHSYYINKMLSKLKKLFNSTSFSELLNRHNQQYSKRLEKIRASYCSVSETYPNAVDLKFELSLHAMENLLLCIADINHLFSNFKRQLQQQDWYKTQVIYTFYQIMRDDQRQRYVIRFFLTFNTMLFTNTAIYCNELEKLWNMATNGMGVIFCSNMSSACDKLNDGNTLRINRIIQEEIYSPLSALDEMPDHLTNLEGLSHRICAFPFAGFHPFEGNPIRYTR